MVSQPLPRNYPIPTPEGDDPRFTLGLAVDVAQVLQRHGYPPVEHGADLVELQALLYRFIYLGEDSL